MATHGPEASPKAKKTGIASKFASSVRRLYKPKSNKLDVEKKYKIGKLLGTGNFAEVKLGTDKKTGAKFAIKIIEKSLCAGKEDMIEMELTVLKQAKHCHIVGMHEYFDTPDKLYLVLDYVEGGELFDRIVDEGNFTERDASRIVRQMTEAIQYLHNMDIVHRDLKPENILFADRETTDSVLITDFGLAKLANEGAALKTACGTPNYVAPEILRQQGYNKEVDVWSLGVIAFILLCGYPPFYNESDAVLFEMIMKGHFEFDERYWKHISAEAKGLIKGMLEVKPERRLTTQQVLDHPWITGRCDVPQVNLSKSISMNLKKHNIPTQGSDFGDEATSGAPIVEGTTKLEPLISDAGAEAEAHARASTEAIVAPVAASRSRGQGKGTKV